MSRRISPVLSAFSIFAAAGFLIAGCDFLSSPASKTYTPQVAAYKQVNLVSDTTSFGAQVVDKNLANPWGIAASANGKYWIADNHSGMTSIYDGSGNPQGAAVTVRGPDDGAGTPTGLVANTTADFQLPGGTPSAFLFAGEDGSITAWGSGDTAAVVIAEPEAVFKGIAMAADAGQNFLYLADFHNGRIDVYDGAFQKDSTRRFVDSTLPAGFAPFNITAVGGNLYVAYAKAEEPERMDDEKGPGNGYIDVFTPGGVFVKRFASGGTLNSPWGMAFISAKFGNFTNGFYVGNFGDGRINVFDTTGTLLGQLGDSSGNAVKIDGLWALYPSPDNTLYFTAGPNDEAHGLFGYITP